METTKGITSEKMASTEIQSSHGHYIWNASIIENTNLIPGKWSAILNKDQQPAINLIPSLQSGRAKGLIPERIGYSQNPIFHWSLPTRC